ncbi:hypothetical protein L7F22_030544 [Adiantum nelumboides]|nr:hypothetical protein [Adiantum nelumboides]
MGTQRSSTPSASTSSGSLAILPLSPLPTTSHPSPYTPTLDGFSSAQAGSIQTPTQQTTNPPRHVFSRHDSFTHTHPPPAFSSFQDPSSIASEAAAQPSFSRLSSFQNPKSRRAINRIVSMDRRRAPEIFSAGEDVWKGEFVPAVSAKLLEDRTTENSLMHGEMKWHSGSNWGRTLSLLWTSKRGSGAKKLTILILLNFAYSTVELFVGLFSGRVELQVAYFRCILTVSLIVTLNICHLPQLVADGCHLSGTRSICLSHGVVVRMGCTLLLARRCMLISLVTFLPAGWKSWPLNSFPFSAPRSPAGCMCSSAQQFGQLAILFAGCQLDA